jgi:hypothetical protein
MRELTMEMAKQKALGPPGYDLSIVHSALQLGPKCGVAYDEATHASAPPQPAPPDACSGTCIYVDPSKGIDKAGSGSITSPLKTIAAGVAAARKAAAPPATVVLRGGTHWQKESLVLTQADSGLTLRSYSGESATVSGGVPLTGLNWKPHDQTAGRNIWVADVTAAEPRLSKIPGLRLDGERVQIARHPNGDPERQGKHTFPSGWNAGAVSWLPGHAASLDLVNSAMQVLVTEPSRAEAYAVYPYYAIGLGGLCNDLFTPNASFWCNPRNPRDGLHGVWNGSGGLTYNSSMLPLDAISSANMSHAQAHVWSGTGWASQIWSVGSHDPASKTITWGRGGFQDARASPEGEEWYIENVFELLDGRCETLLTFLQRGKQPFWQQNDYFAKTGSGQT